jgi:hypothetical protein
MIGMASIDLGRMGGAMIAASFRLAHNMIGFGPVQAARDVAGASGAVPTPILP